MSGHIGLNKDNILDKTKLTFMLDSGQAPKKILPYLL